MFDNFLSHSQLQQCSWGGRQDIRWPILEGPECRARCPLETVRRQRRGSCPLPLPQARRRTSATCRRPWSRQDRRALFAINARHSLEPHSHPPTQPPTRICVRSLARFCTCSLTCSPSLETRSGACLCSLAFLMQVSINEQGYAHTCPTEPQPSSHETNKENQNQFFTISLDADLASIGNLEEYVRELRQDLAYAADIDPKFIRFASLRAGSIVNVLWVEPGAGEPIKVVRELQLQVNDCNSRLLSGKWTSKTIGLVIAGEGRGEQQLMVELSKLKVQLQRSGVPDRGPEIAHGTKAHTGEGTAPIPRPATPPTTISEYAAQACYDPTFSGKVELDLKPPSEDSSSPLVKQPTVVCTVEEEVAAWIDTIAKLSGKVQITKQISPPFSPTCVGRCLFRMRVPCLNARHVPSLVSGHSLGLRRRAGRMGARCRRRIL